MGLITKLEFMDLLTSSIIRCQAFIEVFAVIATKQLSIKLKQVESILILRINISYCWY